MAKTSKNHARFSILNQDPRSLLLHKLPGVGLVVFGNERDEVGAGDIIYAIFFGLTYTKKLKPIPHRPIEQT